MIVVTGAAGFIGSCLISKLNSHNFNHVVAVDDFNNQDKNKNLAGKKIIEKVDRNQFFDWLDRNGDQTEFIFHIGARTDTTEFNRDIFLQLNVHYSQQVWQKCLEYQIPLIYASSAATYGMGENGYDDSEALVHRLKPLNPYGESKNDFDKWAVTQAEKPFFWAGLKFFNVFGPNEYHKGRMASVIWHAFHQIQKTGKMKLFKSHHPDFGDGKQLRDFIYVKDVVNVCYFLMHHRQNSGLYNLGTGKARTFEDLTKATFMAMNKPPIIEFVDTPIDIRDKYQYFTEANMDKIRSIGYKNDFTSLENGVMEYVSQYLARNQYY